MNDMDLPDDAHQQPDTPPSELPPRVYFFCPGENAFYLSDELPLYAAAGTMPADLVEVTPELFQQYAVDLPPEGKARVAGSDGMPAWGDPPALPDAVIAARNRAQLEAHLAEAAARIAPLQDAADLDMATPAELDTLRAWKVYRVELARVEQQEGYPLRVQWPAPPAVQQ